MAYGFDELYRFTEVAVREVSTLSPNAHVSAVCLSIVLFVEESFEEMGIHNDSSAISTIFQPFNPRLHISPVVIDC